MPSIYQLKPAFQNLLRPLVNLLAKSGITANQVTLAAIALSFFIGATITIGHQFRWLLLLVPLALFLRMALNAIDGMLAREHDMKTPLGAILNELGDVFADAAIYLPFSLISGVSGILVVPVVTLSIVSEMAGVLGVMAGSKRQYDGPMGKSDRAFTFSIIALSIALGITPGLWLDLVLVVMIVLLSSTIANRVSSTLREIENNRVNSTSN